MEYTSLVSAATFVVPALAVSVECVRCSCFPDYFICRVWASTLVLPDLNWTDLDAREWILCRQATRVVGGIRESVDGITFAAKGIQALMLYSGSGRPRLQRSGWLPSGWTRRMQPYNKRRNILPFLL